MAYAALASVLHISDEILNSDHFSGMSKTQQIIHSLHDGVDFLLSFLEGSLPNAAPTEEILATRMRDAAYEAEDVLENYLANHYGYLQDSDSGEEQNQESISHELDRVLKDINSMKEEAKLIDNARRTPDWEQTLPTHAVGSSTHDAMIGKNTVVGVDDDLLQIKDRLTGHQSNLQIIPVVGMGGIGKTTLARNLYDDQLIVEQFDIRALVKVAQEYNTHKILLGLLGGIRVTPTNRDDQLEEHLYKSLKGRRYLLVLDDVWDTKAWDDFRRLFPDDCNGSRIVLTTRLLDVAVYAAGHFSPPHRMHLLSKDQSWELLCQVVFGGKHCCPSELEQSGKMIAKNCRGLPLAIVVIGGLLSKANMTKEYWEYVAENVHSVVTEKDENFLGILSLSYKHLPQHLRACFVYMAAFPEGYEISGTRLIRLWTSEGLLKPVESGQHLEQAAEAYLKDLVDRNLILVRQKKPNGKPKTCSIHDLLRDLCVREAHREKFLYVLTRGIRFRPDEAKGYRRLSIHPNVMQLEKEFDVDDELSAQDSMSLDEVSVSNDGSAGSDNDASSNASVGSNNEDDYENVSVVQSMPLARSFLCTACYSDVCSSDFCSRLVRVVHAYTVFDQPAELPKLPNLRHISLGYLENVPSSIYLLRNLHTINVLDLNDKHLPSEIWEMPQLRHLQFNECFLPPFQSSQSDTIILKNLQTLSRVIDFCSAENILRKIPNLRTLKVMYEDASDVEEWSKFSLDNLVKLSKLETLSCIFDGTPNASLMQSLSFPVSLKKLTLSGCKLAWEYMTVVGQLPNLEALKLQDEAFQGQVWETNEDEFCKLRFLLIEKSDPSEWRAESSHFPSLQRLVLRKCYSLQEIPSEVVDIPALQAIELDTCSQAIEASAREIQDENGEIRVVFRQDIGITLEDIEDPPKLRAWFLMLKEFANDFIRYHNAVKSLL